MATLQVQPRSALGKKVKSLRKQGITPLHLYGPGIPSASLQADTASVRKTLVRVGRNHPIALQVDGANQSEICFVRDVAFDPVSAAVHHVDLLRVDITKPMELDIPVHVHGEAPATKEGATVNIVLREVPVECLPLEAPDAINVDISGLNEPGDAVRASDLKLPSGVKLLIEPDQVIVNASLPSRAATEEAAPAPAEGAAVPAEGAVPAQAEGAPAKPAG
jgi:large subunit ribosomal protein L25